MIETQDAIVVENVELNNETGQVNELVSSIVDRIQLNDDNETATTDQFANLVSSVVDKLDDSNSSISSTLTNSESSETSLSSIKSSDDNPESNLKKQQHKSDDVNVKSVKV